MMKFWPYRLPQNSHQVRPNKSSFYPNLLSIDISPNFCDPRARLTITKGYSLLPNHSEFFIVRNTLDCLSIASLLCGQLIIFLARTAPLPFADVNDRYFKVGASIIPLDDCPLDNKIAVVLRTYCAQHLVLIRDLINFFSTEYCR